MRDGKPALGHCVDNSQKDLLCFMKSLPVQLLVESDFVVTGLFQIHRIDISVENAGENQIHVMYANLQV